MKKLHALGAGVVGVALSATAALAAAPHPTTHGVATGDASPSSATSASTTVQAPADNHGAAVSAVATDETKVGGKNDNHGGAVSAVARGTHGPKGNTPDAVTPATADAPTDNHGAAVSAVAKDETKVGGKNDNHGGAVSAVAHGTHGPNGHSTGH